MVANRRLVLKELQMEDTIILTVLITSGLALLIHMLKKNANLRRICGSGCESIRLIFDFKGRGVVELCQAIPPSEKTAQTVGVYRLCA